MNEPERTAAPGPSDARDSTESLVRGLVAGGALACIEIAIVLAIAAQLFLSWIELGRYAVLALSALPLLAALAAVALARGWTALGRGLAHGGAQHLRRLRIALFALSVPLSAATFWLLTAGRRARDLPVRPLLVLLAAAAVGGALALCVPWLLRAREQAPGRRVAWSTPLWVAAAAALAIDALVLRRLYPAFHAALSTLALLSALAAVLLVPLPARAFARPRRATGLLALAALLALVSLVTLPRAPNARFAIREGAPFSGKLLDAARLAARTEEPPARVAARPRPAALPGTQAGVDLRGRDVLLITIDALRADRLSAYGGAGLTPAMDALAAESAVFTRAYTPTPHTSYAIASLLCGKFMQPLFALADAGTDHATLPRLLRHHGYRTAAFYPPAIFFVDEGRFDWLHRDQLGFEYVKAMFAPAGDRVDQLQVYLNEVDKGHPLFVWVHLFEPHEPYDPQGVEPADDSPRARYDAEVAVADAGVGRLIETFRRSRPGATVILTADHGEEFGEHGGHHHGTTLYDEQVRVPLLWSSPGAVKPRAITAPVEIIDVTTSLLSALGIPREARMRGDDLGPLLAGAADAPGLHAFASIDRARMVTDGRDKLICGEGECRLFDLVGDPAERRDVSLERPDVVAALKGELAAFAASLPRIEALALGGGGAIPEALARAKLHDRTVGPELVPLLSSPSADVRAAAARAIGDLSVASALPVLGTVRARDGDAAVRAEAAIAALRLDDGSAVAQVRELLAGTARELARSAALALCARGEGSGEAILIEAAADAELTEPERLAAVAALARCGGSAAARALVALLADVRLGAAVAEVLGAIGDRGSADALAAALAIERYPEARQAEAAALLAIAARVQRGGAALRRTALAQVKRFLGTESALPHGVGLLLSAGELARASGAGADLRHAAEVRRGEWLCGDRGCRPIASASIALPGRGAPAGPARVSLRIEADAPGRLALAGQTFAVGAGATELGWLVPDGRKLHFDASADEGLWLQAIAVVKAQQDIPPPEPSLSPPVPLPVPGSPSPP